MKTMAARPMILLIIYTYIIFMRKVWYSSSNWLFHW